MNDNHSPHLAAALDAVHKMPAYSEAERNFIRIAVRNTTASAGSQERPLSLLTCVVIGALSLALVWIVIGPTWVAAINWLAAVFS